MGGEKKIGFISRAQIAKFGLLEYYSILITDKRLIIGKLSGKGTKAAVLGFGFPGYAAARKGQDKSKYAGAGPEEILKADKKNFAIPFEDIDQVEVKTYRWSIGDFKRGITVRLRSGGKKKFGDIDEESFKSLPMILRQAIGDKLVDRT